MLPVGHAAVGVLVYAVLSLLIERGELSMASIVSVLLGSQFPDLIDKPLAYYQILPSGRSLGHSLLFAAVAIGVLLAIVPYRHRWAGIAFSVGFVMHPLIDGVHALLAADLPGFLFWPITRAPRYGNETAPWIRLIQIYSSPDIGAQTTVLVGCAIMAIGIRSLVNRGYLLESG